jgi:hypothetical protein
VAGGVGIVKNVYIGGIVAISSSINSTDVSTGSLRIQGGLGVSSDAYIGNCHATNTLYTDYFAKQTVVSDGINVSAGSRLLVLDTTESVSVGTGAVQVSGGE